MRLFLSTPGRAKLSVRIGIRLHALLKLIIRKTKHSFGQELPTRTTRVLQWIHVYSSHYEAIVYKFTKRISLQGKRKFHSFYAFVTRPPESLKPLPESRSIIFQRYEDVYAPHMQVRQFRDYARKHKTSMQWRDKINSKRL